MIINALSCFNGFLHIQACTHARIRLVFTCNERLCTLVTRTTHSLWCAQCRQTLLVLRMTHINAIHTEIPWKWLIKHWDTVGCQCANINTDSVHFIQLFDNINLLQLLSQTQVSKCLPTRNVSISKEPFRLIKALEVLFFALIRSKSTLQLTNRTDVSRCVRIFSVYVKTIVILHLPNLLPLASASAATSFFCSFAIM